MKKREISPVELKKIVELRQFGANWTEVERETKIERRAAKRAYDEWERDQKMEEQQKARFRVAAEAFHEHVNDLIRLAETLINHLPLPSSPDDAPSAEKHIYNLWQRNFLEEPKPYVLSQAESGRQIWSTERLNLMIFKSLKDHTHEKVRWEILNEWGKAWDSCRGVFDKMKIEIQNWLLDKMKKTPDLLEEIKERNKEDAIQQLALAMVYEIWRSVVNNKFDPKCPKVKGSYESFDRILAISTERAQYQNVIALCDDLLESLLKSDKVDLVNQLCNEVDKVRKAIDDLAEQLNRLVLYPIILHTRCDLCPA